MEATAVEMKELVEALGLRFEAVSRGPSFVLFADNNVEDGGGDGLEVEGDTFERFFGALDEHCCGAPGGGEGLVGVMVDIA